MYIHNQVVKDILKLYPSIKKATKPTVNMSTARDMYKGSDDYSDVKCSVCAKQNTDKIADYYCYDCRKHLCTSCSGIHNDHIENHNVVQGHGDNKDVLTERCGKHAEELITLYCRQHNELLCRKCHLLDHRKCQDLQNIRESADELNADLELQAVPAQLKSALDNIYKAIEALDNHKACIQNTGDGFLKDLEEYAKKLLSRIEELREKGKADIKSKQEELLSEAKQHRQACVLCKDEISQCLDKITKSNEWKANMFVLKKKGQTIAQKVDTLYNDSGSLIKEHQFSFKTNSLKCFSSLVNDVYVKDISSLSAVGGVVQATVGRPGDSRVEKLKKRPVEKPSGEKSQQVRKFKARSSENKYECFISGCCVLSDGSLVIADSKNSRLKRVDPSSGTVTQYFDMAKGPVNVCGIGPQELLVAFGYTQVHVHCAVSLTRTRTIELGHHTSKIACHGGLLYCAPGGWGSIILYVHDVSDGRKLWEIRLHDIYEGLYPEIPDITDIAVNGPGDRLYVTDWRTGLLCVNTDGQQIFRLSQADLGLSGAQGVTTDHSGHVFVCGRETNNVVTVTKDGHMVGQILSKKDGIEEPRCLSYDESKCQLCVGGGSDQILMVEWK